MLAVGSYFKSSGPHTPAQQMYLDDLTKITKVSDIYISVDTCTYLEKLGNLAISCQVDIRSRWYVGIEERILKEGWKLIGSSLTEDNWRVSSTSYRFQKKGRALSFFVSTGNQVISVGIQYCHTCD
jgi:hypothetical protein